MTLRSSESASAGEVTKEAATPEWPFAVFLFGMVSLVFRFGSAWSWCSALGDGARQRRRDHGVWAPREERDADG
jgi:hypothetical protein